MTTEEKNTIFKAVLESKANGFEVMIKCKRHFIKYGEVHTLSLNGMALQKDYWQMELLMPDDDLKFIPVGEKGFTPIYRSLSQLTSPITVEGYNDGKEFVPVNELKDFFGWEYLWSFVNKNQGDFNCYAVAKACLDRLISWGFWIYDQSYFERGLIVKTK